MRNNIFRTHIVSDDEVHQNVLGPEIDISDVLDRETHTL